MRVPESWTRTYEFACHSKVCAPPPAGRGGSDKGGGHAVTGPKLPLYNAVTGRLSPSPVRKAFQQGMDEIIRPHKMDTKRTTLKGGKVRTEITYKGRVIRHKTSKGGAERHGFREGG